MKTLPIHIRPAFPPGPFVYSFLFVNGIRLFVSISWMALPACGRHSWMTGNE